MRFRSIKGLIATVLLVALPALAQEQKGSIVGTLKDATGGVLPGVTIEARGAKLVGVATATSDTNGTFRFPALPPGAYEVTATLQGFAPAKVSGVEVSLGQIKSIDLILKVGGIEKEITVTGEAPLIDVKQSATATSIRDELIEKLPRGRDFTSVITQAAAASNESKLAGISIDGASGAENRYIIDGIDTTNLRTGQNAKNLITDFVDEVQVKSSGYAAEYGGATGGVINVISKGGGNKWAGDLASYFSGSALNGDVRQTLRLNPNTEESEYITYPRDGYTRIEPGFTVGGPVATDRMWMFASYLPQLTTWNRDIVFNGQTDTKSFRQQERVHYANANITAQITSNLRARLTTNLSPYQRVGSLPAQDGTGNPTFDYPNLDRVEPNTSVSGNMDFTASNQVYFGLRGGYFSYDAADKGVPNEVRFSFSGRNSVYSDIPASFIRPSGYNNIPTNTATTRDLNTRLSMNFDGTYFASLGGEHAFKAGVQFDRIGNDVQSGYQKPRFLLAWNQSLGALDGRVLKGKYGYYRVFSIVTTGNINSNNVGLFFQDTWTINNRFTLNFGIRTESEKIPSFRTDLGQTPDAIDFKFGDKLAPRVGFAWDLQGDGMWKAYGSWGVFYDITKLEMPRGSFGGDQWLDYRYSLDTYDWNTLPGPNCPPTCPGTFYEVVDFRHPSNDPTANTIDPALKPMRSQELTLGLQHELSRSMSLGLRYVHKQLDRTIEDVGVVVPGVGEVYYIANPGFGLAEYTLPGLPAQPKATRDYDGVELDFRKRFSDRWSVHASYLWSRLSGNYSGLASSDEDGRSSPNVNRFFDNLVMSFDQAGKPVFGLLATDRTHSFKAQAIYEFPFGLSAGLNAYVASGTPLSRSIPVQSSTPVFYLGRGSDGRTPTYSQFDLLLSHDFKFGDGTRLQLSLNINNLFDQKTATSYDMSPYRDILPVCDPDSQDCTGQFTLKDFFAGFDVVQEVAKQNSHVDANGDPIIVVRPNPNFQQASGFQGSRNLRFGLKYIF